MLRNAVFRAGRTRSEWKRANVNMNRPKILFICVHNSARSQMAEAFLNDICGAEFEARSAGLEPGTLNPLVVEVMREAGFDISKNKTQAVFDVFKSGQLFAYVVTVCSEAEAGGCPFFPGPTRRLHWPFPDPSRVEGTSEEKLEKIREIRNAIQARVEQFCAEHCKQLTERSQK
jgi:arsenate reductase (thioredoxin)